MGYKTTWINLQKIDRNDKLATIMPRLMMACNDISLSNVCLIEYKAKLDRKDKFTLNKLSIRGKESFYKLCSCVVDKDNKWKKYFVPIRHNLSFHYNDKGKSKYIRDALRERISIKGQRTSKITIGNVKEMRFELGDEIVDSIICRKIFALPYTIDLERDRTDLDKILEFGSDICKAFLIFGSEFINRTLVA